MNSLNRRATINPYLAAASAVKDSIWNSAREVADRLRWDLTLEAFKSRQKLSRWNRISHSGLAVIVCNGPSLLNTDLSLCKSAFTIGLNKINLLFSRSDFRPSVIVAVNDFVVQQNAEFYKETQIPLFLTHRALATIPSRESVTFLHTVRTSKFARNISMSVNEGSTVTYVAMQLAYYLGFRRVALVGCDHNFATSGPANQTVTSGQNDPNHFDPRYFAGGVKWQLPDLQGSEASYMLAKEIYEQSGREIVNCTVGGKLEIFPRVLLRDFVAGGSPPMEPGLGGSP